MSTNVYKNPLNIPKTGHELVTCHYPLRLDTYSGCAHNCVYCYARNLLSKIGYWKNIRAADINQIRKYFENPNIIPENKLRKSVRHKLPVRLGGLTDCFQPQEKRDKVTYEVLKILNQYGYPYLIVTKSDLVAEGKYIEVMDTNLAYPQITITSLENTVSKKIEKGAPFPDRRLDAIEKLSESGFFVAGRISPIIPNVTLNETESIITELKARGARHILVEFFRGNSEMVKELEKAVDIDIHSLLTKRGYYYRYNLKEKMAFYKRIKKFTESLGLTFSICSDGDPIPPNLNTTKNCCGTDFLPHFRECVTCVANNVYFESLKSGVTLNKMKEKYWSPDYSKFEKYWKSGELENLVHGIKKVGETYINLNLKMKHH